jgi:hypothetical protein
MIVSIMPDVPFSLDAAAAFGFGPNTGRPAPDRGVMRLAFVTDDLRHHAGVELTQAADATVIASVDSDAQIDAPRLASYVSHFYDLGLTAASPGQLQAISDRWRPFRTWTAVLVRVAGDRLRLPFEQPSRTAIG